LLPESPGLIALFGSGETSLSGGRIFEALARAVRPPLEMTLVETPAGFELNSQEVIQRVAEFARSRLHNYHPRLTIVPARKKGTDFSPDDPQVAAPLLRSNLIFLGPGSPTYAVRQLQGSLVWNIITARQRLGAALALASAATIAAGALALPVYEIYKVGEEPHWKAGLDLLAPFGLRLVFIPHWDNAEGGAGLDTSRCFIGRARYESLLAELPDWASAVGVDEHTGLLIDIAKRQCRVIGRGGVTLRCAQNECRFEGDSVFEIERLGSFRMAEAGEGIPAQVWAQAQLEDERSIAAATSPSAVVLDLLERRSEARARREWALADRLRQEIAELGWTVVDTSSGSHLEPNSTD